MTDRGQTIRTSVDGVRETGRNAQGVKLMSIADDERVVAFEPIGESRAGAVLDGGSIPPEANDEESGETEGEALEGSNGAGGDGEPEAN